MITKEKSLEALAWLETYDSEGHCGSHAVTLRQYIEETADLRRQLEGFESALLLTRKALCGDINNQDDIVDMASDLRRQLAEAQAENDAFRKAWNFDELVKQLKEQLAEAQEEKNRLVRDLDVLWNGEEGAAKQASLCDIVAQISKELPSLREAQARLAELEGQEPVVHQFQCEDGTWHGFINERHYINTVEDESWPIRALYAHPAHSPSDQKDAARWMPIETAPKETAVLLATEFDGQGDWRIKCGSYYDRCWHVWGASWTPTHWMPLPAAPDAEMLAASPGGQDAAPPDSPAHRAAKVLREALERFISDGVSESYICACHRPSGHVCNRCMEIAKQNPLRTALATAKQIMDEAEATK